MRVLVALSLCACALATPAHAEETDFLPESVAWNGCSELAELAAGLQLQVQLVEELDWEQLPRRASVLVVHPVTSLDPDDVMTFVRGGGKLLVADDFGSSRALLDRLGIERLDGRGIRAARHHNGNPNLPIASADAATRGAPARANALTAGVSEVVTNHPAYFASQAPTLLGFRRDQQLLVAGRVGSGSFVALADPSVLINSMLRFEGNQTLATNLLRYLAPPEDNRLLMVTGQFRVKGHPLPPTARGQTTSAQRFLAEYNEFLGHLNDFALTQPALRALAFVCGSLTLVGLLLFLPLPRRPLDGHWLRPQGAPRWSFEDQVTRFGKGRLAGATYPAVILREEIEDRIGQALKAPGPIATIHTGWVLEQVRQRAGAEAEQLCRRLLAALRQIPTSMRAEEAPLVRGVQRKDLAHVYDMGSKLLSLLGQETLPPICASTAQRPKGASGRESPPKRDHAPHR
jgi:hypothetical protein